MTEEGGGLPNPGLSGTVRAVKANLRQYDSGRSEHEQDFLQKHLNPEFFSRDEVREELTNLDYTPCVNRTLGVCSGVSPRRGEDVW